MQIEEGIFIVSYIESDFGKKDKSNFSSNESKSFKDFEKYCLSDQYGFFLKFTNLIRSAGISRYSEEVGFKLGFQFFYSNPTELKKAFNEKINAVIEEAKKFTDYKLKFQVLTSLKTNDLKNNSLYDPNSLDISKIANRDNLFIKVTFKYETKNPKKIAPQVRLKLGGYTAKKPNVNLFFYQKIGESVEKLIIKDNIDGLGNKFLILKPMEFCLTYSSFLELFSKKRNAIGASYEYSVEDLSNYLEQVEKNKNLSINFSPETKLFDIDMVGKIEDVI